MKRIHLQAIDAKKLAPVTSILGVTSSGKSSLAQSIFETRKELGLTLPLLLSVDSVAVYRELDIGSAKPSGTELHGYGWTGVNLVDPVTKLSAAAYVAVVSDDITRALSDLRPVLLVGGSLFYERALVDGMSPGEASDPDFLAELSLVSNSELYKRLASIDPRFKEKIHEHDRYRLLRALDLNERQGVSFDDLYLKPKHRPAEWQNLWQSTDVFVCPPLEYTDTLKERLQNRIEKMFSTDWVDEVLALIEKWGPDAQALSSVGYAEIASWIQKSKYQGKKNLGYSDKFLSELQALKSRILERHLQLAKQQRTWQRSLITKASS